VETPGGLLDLELPADDAARALLARVDVPDQAIDEILAARPQPGDEAWARLRDMHHELVTRSKPTCWPTVPHDAEGTERWVQLWAFVAALPHGLALDADRGVPEAITWTTLRDIGANVRGYLATHGRPGFDGAFWLCRHVRSTVYRLGRLQFDIETAHLDPGPTAPYGQGDPILGVHIPAVGPLTADLCDDAFARARAFFPRFVSDRHPPIGTCRSWLLADGLGELLPPASNIGGFRRRFTLVEGSEEPGDDQVLWWVFGRPHTDPALLEPQTRLQRAVVDHLLDGGHFVMRTGWLHL
jgi:hypothetical protein